MRWLVVLACMMFLASPSYAQQASRTASGIERLAPALPPLGGALSPPVVEDGRVLSLAAKERPVWLFPAVGAAAGALIGLAVGGGCGDHDCTISIPPPVLGAVYGGVIGLIVELAL